MTGLDPMAAVRLSLLVGLGSMLISTPLALGLGWLLARKRFFGKPLVTTLLLAPLVMPPVVTGFLLLEAFGAQSPVGQWLATFGIRIPFSLTGAVLASLVMALPLYLLTVRTAFEAADPRLEEVSWTLGVPPAQTWWRITLPIALPGITAGAILGFARALGEFGATAVLSGNIEGQTRTIPLAIYTLLESPKGDEQIRLLVWISLGLSFMSLLAYEGLVRQLRSQMEDEGR